MDEPELRIARCDLVTDALRYKAISWLILIAAQMIMPHSAKLICNASVIANPACFLTIALLNEVIGS